MEKPLKLENPRGRNLFDLRKLWLQLSQMELAELLDCDQTHISKAERRFDSPLPRDLARGYNELVDCFPEKPTMDFAAISETLSAYRRRLREARVQDSQGRIHRLITKLGELRPGVVLEELQAVGRSAEEHKMRFFAAFDEVPLARQVMAAIGTTSWPKLFLMLCLAGAAASALTAANFARPMVQLVMEMGGDQPQQIPDHPVDPDQKKPPCSPAEESIGGGCWVKFIPANGKCTDFTRGGSCYRPVWRGQQK